MKGKEKRRGPEIVFREGKPTAMILDVDEYQEMLERMRKGPLSFKRLDDFLEEYSRGV